MGLSSIICDQAWEKQVLSTQNTVAYIMVRIFCSVCAIQNLLIVLHSSWISTYMMTF